MFPSAAGRLLVATPLLTDPSFDRTVVYVCVHDANGAFGLVLNRPTEARGSDLIPEWAPRITTPDVLLAGGPVERSSFMGLGRVARAFEDVPAWWTPLRGNLGVVNLAGDPAEAEPLEALEALRIFHGYAGWGAGQLDVEIGEDAWFVVDARPEDPFALDPSRLWNRVLQRQRGHLALYGHYPRDPDMN